MNKPDIELPPLPEPFTYTRPGVLEGPLFHNRHMQAYAISAIEADRKRRDNDQQPFGYFRPEPFGWTDCAATDEGAIALYERPQVRGKPVDIRQEVIETLEMILAADWRKWEELASPDEFVRWAKSRANYALSIINEAPQPAEPTKSRGEPEYLISACYFPGHDEVELTWERKSDGAKAALTCKVTPEQGKQIANVVWPCVYHAAAPQPAEPVKVPSDVIDAVSRAMSKAWYLGQTYWQQADSNYSSQWKKSDATREKFNTLVDETRALLARYGSKP